MKDQIEGLQVATVLLHNRAVVITVDAVRRHPMVHTYSLVARPDGTSTRWEFSAGASHPREVAKALLRAADELENARPSSRPVEPDQVRRPGVPPTSWTQVEGMAPGTTAATAQEGA